MGVLDSGNYYLEVKAVDQIDDVDTPCVYCLREGQIMVSIHCGSRGLGHQIGTDYFASMAMQPAAWASVYPTGKLRVRRSIHQKGGNTSVQ